MMGAFGGMAGYGGGPERAGCGSYCSVLDDLSRELLEQDTTAQLQLQGHQEASLDAMVASRVTLLHDRRVALNKASWSEHEAPRTPETTTLYDVRLDEHDGELHLYHSEAQQFVHNMFTNTARVAQRAEREFGIKGLYNREEHETFLQIEKAVLSGRAAAGVWAAYDASGTVRYVSQIENRDGIVQAKWIDVGRIGRDLTPDEGISLLRRIAGENRRSRFIANDGAVPYIIVEQEALRSNTVLDATSTVIAERLTNARIGESRFDSVELVDPRSANTDAVPSHHVPAAISETEEMRKRAIASELQTRIPPDVAAMGTLKVTEVMHERSNGFSLVELVDAYVTPRILRAADSFRKEERSVDKQNAAAQWLSMKQESRRLTLENIREKPVGVAQEIKKRHEGMRKSVAALVLAAETKVAIGAAPLVLAELAKEQPKPIRAVEKSIRRHEKKVLQLRKLRKVPTFAEATAGERKVREVRHIVKTTRGRREVREARKTIEITPRLKSKSVDLFIKGKERKARKKRRKVYMQSPAGSRGYILGERGGRKDQRRGKRGSEKVVKKIAAVELMTLSTLKKREGRRIRRLRQVARRKEVVLEDKHLSKWEKRRWMKLKVAAAEFRKLASLVLQEVVLRSWDLQNEKEKLKKQPSSNMILLRVPAGVYPGLFRGTEMTQSGERSRERDDYFSERIKQKERMAIAGVQFTWMVWMLLNSINFLSVGSRRTAFNLEGQVFRDGEQKRLDFRWSLSRAQSRDRDDRRISGDDSGLMTTWVLLSIIWYLTMIREQKVYRSPFGKTLFGKPQDMQGKQLTVHRKKKNSNFKSKGKQILRWQLPSQAIIFACYS